MSRKMTRSIRISSRHINLEIFVSIRKPTKTLSTKMHNHHGKKMLELFLNCWRPGEQVCTSILIVTLSERAKSCSCITPRFSSASVSPTQRQLQVGQWGFLPTASQSTACFANCSNCSCHSTSRPELLVEGPSIRWSRVGSCTTDTWF